MFKFNKNQTYRRQEIWNHVTGGNKKMTRNFQQSGYERIGEDLFAFINIGSKGKAGKIKPNICECQNIASAAAPGWLLQTMYQRPATNPH